MQRICFMERGTDSKQGLFVPTWKGSYDSTIVQIPVNNFGVTFYMGCLMGSKPFQVTIFISS